MKPAVFAVMAVLLIAGANAQGSGSLLGGKGKGSTPAVAAATTKPASSGSGWFSGLMSSFGSKGKGSTPAVAAATTKPAATPKLTVPQVSLPTIKSTTTTAAPVSVKSTGKGVDLSALTKAATSAQSSLTSAQSSMTAQAQSVMSRLGKGKGSTPAVAAASTKPAVAMPQVSLPTVSTKSAGTGKGLDLSALTKATTSAQSTVSTQASALTTQAQGVLSSLGKGKGSTPAVAAAVAAPAKGNRKML